MIYANPDVELDEADAAIDGEEPISADELTCNDPVLFVAQGSVQVVVPMDDGMPPALFHPELVPGSWSVPHCRARPVLWVYSRAGGISPDPRGMSAGSIWMLRGPARLRSGCPNAPVRSGDGRTANTRSDTTMCCSMA